MTTDIDELLTRLYEAELEYKKELVQVEHDKELMGVKPDLKKKLDLVELECECNHLNLAQSIELLSCADLVVFEEEYFQGRGTRIEHEICEMYGLKHFHEWELKDEEIIECALKKL